MSKLLMFAVKTSINKSFQSACMNITRKTHWTVQAAGNREQVGFGINGDPVYQDRTDFPFPAVRWKEPTPEICCLWEKEKGDWGKLTRDEKKELYRASFCQTFAEIRAPNPDYKFVIGMVFWCCTLAIWLFYLIQVFGRYSFYQIK